jgi:hypothetical protein
MNFKDPKVYEYFGLFPLDTYDRGSNKNYRIIPNGWELVHILTDNEQAVYVNGDLKYVVWVVRGTQNMEDLKHDMSLFFSQSPGEWRNKYFGTLTNIIRKFDMSYKIFWSSHSLGAYIQQNVLLQALRTETYTLTGNPRYEFDRLFVSFHERIAGVFSYNPAEIPFDFNIRSFFDSRYSDMIDTINPVLITDIRPKNNVYVTSVQFLGSMTMPIDIISASIVVNENKFETVHFIKSKIADRILGIPLPNYHSLLNFVSDDTIKKYDSNIYNTIVMEKPDVTSSRNILDKMLRDANIKGYWSLKNPVNLSAEQQKLLLTSLKTLFDSLELKLLKQLSENEIKALQAEEIDPSDIGESDPLGERSLLQETLSKIEIHNMKQFRSEVNKFQPQLLGWGLYFNSIGDVEKVNDVKSVLAEIQESRSVQSYYLGYDYLKYLNEITHQGTSLPQSQSASLRRAGDFTNQELINMIYADQPNLSGNVVPTLPDVQPKKQNAQLDTLNQIYALPQGPVQPMPTFTAPEPRDFKKITTKHNDLVPFIPQQPQTQMSREELIQRGRDRFNMMRQHQSQKQQQSQIPSIDSNVVPTLADVQPKMQKPLMQNNRQINIYNNNNMNPPVPDLTQRQRASRASKKTEKVIKDVDGQVLQRMIVEETPLQQQEELTIKKMRGRGRPPTKQAIKDIPGSEVLPQPAEPKKAKTVRKAEPKLKPIEQKLVTVEKASTVAKELKKIEKEKAKLEKLRADFINKLNKL